MPTVNDDSILTSVKKLLGLDVAYTAFDTDIVLHINTVLSSLVQMGIGPQPVEADPLATPPVAAVEGGLVILDASTKWSAFISTSKLLQQVKSYVYAKVRLMFDPPANGNLMDALKETAKELEYRLYIECNKEPVVVEETEDE